MNATTEVEPHPRPAWRRAGSWALGYPSTLLLGLVWIAIFAHRSLWVGAVAMVVLTVVMAGGERWADRRYPGAEAWQAFQRGYSALSLIVAAAYGVLTGGGFFVVVLAALSFHPAVLALGRGLRARRAGSA